MDQVGLPHNCALIQDGEIWILRLNEGAPGLREVGVVCGRSLIRIGFASGPEALREKDAQQLARRYLLARMAPGAQTKRSQMTIAEFVETRFVPEYVKAKSVAARSHYYSILKHVIRPDEVNHLSNVEKSNSGLKLAGYPDWPYLDNLRLRDIRPEHVQRLITVASEHGYSPQTVKHIRSVISAIFCYARQELVFMGTNPARPVKIPETVRRNVLALSLPQMERVLRAMRYPEKEMTMIALLTDMHVSEICGLQWKCVNLSGALSNSNIEPIPPISISVTKQWYRGELTNVKDARKRMIQIPEILLSMLLLINGRSRFTRPDDFVLTSRSGAPINVTNITARRLSSIARELEMPGLSWQVFRRAHAAMKQAFGPQFHYHVAAAVSPDCQHLAQLPRIAL